ncbi:hypothetical protein J4H86_26730 [Spiractinospora alimapuensis]|uniref:hypothetical protein n=1 Tax=Spiractinospora alimapuensis TaxID=2820884 RepID=UPI001F3B6D99|nr:hypothetical protein [Spiractinospora alimapuensis]QVQ52243.1 hypothetical protein J4H86_26730 [Spiractinospora alimapuensis]
MPFGSAAEQSIADRLLLDRVLQQRSAHWKPHDAAIDPERSGVIMTGPRAGTRVADLRGRGCVAPLLIDPAAYIRHKATAETPFIVPTDRLGGVEWEICAQRNAGADAAITPTGHIAADDTAALRAVVRKAVTLDRDGVIVALPIHTDWLRPASFDVLFEACRAIPHVKAVIPSGQFDPIALTSRIQNLRRLVGTLDDVAVIRTDLAAFDAVAHGAVFAAIGDSSFLRHAVPPDQRAWRSSLDDGTPDILVPLLMRYNSGLEVAERYAAVEPPRCACSTCLGRDLARFTTDSKDCKAEARAHNVAAVAPWHAELLAEPAGHSRRRWWRHHCALALARYDDVSRNINSLDGFRIPGALRVWATVPLDAGSSFGLG